MAGNAFKNVTQVRWTYFDVPASVFDPAPDGSQAATASPTAFENVALVGVGRFADIRPDAAASSEEADSFAATYRVDLGFVHYRHENGPVGLGPDGVQEPGRFPEAMEHGVIRTKWYEEAQTGITVYRRTPVMQFQTQAFQTQDQAFAAYDPSAKQKLNYIPGERFFYKDSLVNMKRGTNAGAGALEGELYNPAIYERIPAKTTSIWWLPTAPRRTCSKQACCTCAGPTPRATTCSKNRITYIPEAPEQPGEGAEGAEGEGTGEADGDSAARTKAPRTVEMPVRMPPRLRPKRVRASRAMPSPPLRTPCRKRASKTPAQKAACRPMAACKSRMNRSSPNRMPARGRMRPTTSRMQTSAPS